MGVGVAVAGEGGRAGTDSAVHRLGRRRLELLFLLHIHVFVIGLVLSLEEDCLVSSLVLLAGVRGR